MSTPPCEVIRLEPCRMRTAFRGGSGLAAFRGGAEDDAYSAEDLLSQPDDPFDARLVDTAEPHQAEGLGEQWYVIATRGHVAADVQVGTQHLEVRTGDTFVTPDGAAYTIGKGVLALSLHGGKLAFDAGPEYQLRIIVVLDGVGTVTHHEARRGDVFAAPACYSNVEIDGVRVMTCSAMASQPA